MKYRIYTDEVGNPDLGSSENPNERHLSLTGVILELSYVDSVVFPRIESLKRKYFGSHPDEPVILHRKELVGKKPPFHILADPDTDHRFKTELLALLRELDFTVITVGIDKLDHKNRYSVWRFDPYHYCLRVMLERFVPAHVKLQFIDCFQLLVSMTQNPPNKLHFRHTEQFHTG